jgi:predicted flavoprotein YhiN
LAQVGHPRGSRSLSSHLKSRLRLDGLKSALLNECLSADERQDPQRLAQALKRLPLRLVRPRPIDEAISTAGGVRLDSLTPELMSRQHPGVFWAGEMLDWEAPTGGYLLTAAWASGVVAGQGVVRWLSEKR